MSSNRSSVRDAAGGIFVDIGEKSLFYVELEEAESYALLYSSKSAVLMRVRTIQGDDLVMRVSWSIYKRIAYGKGYLGMEVCSDLPFVPVMHSRQIHKVGNTYVGVMTRQYMAGTPLSQVWSVMGDEDKRVIKRDVRMAMRTMAGYTSQNFMELQGRNLATSDPVAYINYRILLSKLTLDLKESDITPLSMDRFDCEPALCHQDLSLGHIIVREGRLSGIVGWGRCDYVPEVADRLKYYFAQPHYDGEKEWYEFVSRVSFSYDPPPPLYSITCMYYHYNLRKNIMSPEYHCYLDSMMHTVSDSLIEQARHDGDEYDDSIANAAEDVEEDIEENVEVDDVPVMASEYSDCGGDQWSQDLHVKADFEPHSGATDPFKGSDTTSETYSDTKSSSRCTSWDDGSTVIDILDLLSVA